MDSKQRHELEQNALAKWIATQYNDWIHPNSSWLGYAALGVLIVIAFIIGTARMNAWSRTEAWKQYHAALSSPQADAELEVIAQSNTGIVGARARLALAQRQLSEGCFQVFIDKNEAIVHLEKAVVSFQQVQKTIGDPQMLQDAAYGLGQCWETLAAARVGDDLAKAEDVYQRIIDTWEDCFVERRARNQLASIRQPGTKMVLGLMAAKVAEVPEQDDIRKSLGFDDSTTPGGFWDFKPFEQPKITIEEPKDNVGAGPEQEPEADEQQPEGVGTKTTQELETDSDGE